jgi:hypothetical protein
MKKKLLWIVIGFLAVLIGGSVLYLVIAKPAVMPTPSAPTNQPQQPSTPEQQPPTVQGEGEYLAYSQEAVSQAIGRKLLFFHASWCPQCRALEASIKQEGVPEDMTIFKVNYDTATELRQRYGITLQTTVVEIDDTGKEIMKFVAYDDPSLPAVLNALSP